MATIKLPVAPILEIVLASLGLPHATFEEQQKDGPVFTCMGILRGIDLYLIWLVLALNLCLMLKIQQA